MPPWSWVALVSVCHSSFFPHFSYNWHGKMSTRGFNSQEPTACKNIPFHDLNWSVNLNQNLPFLCCIPSRLIFSLEHNLDNEYVPECYCPWAACCTTSSVESNAFNKGTCFQCQVRDELQVQEDAGLSTTCFSLHHSISLSSPKGWWMTCFQSAQRSAHSVTIFWSMNWKQDKEQEKKIHHARIGKPPPLPPPNACVI